MKKYLQATKKFQLVIYALTATALWGANYPILKGTSAEIPPLLLLSLRLLISGLIFLPFVKLKRKNAWAIARFSIRQCTINSGACSLGTAMTNGSTGSLISQLSLPFGLVLARIYFNEKIRPAQIVGCLVSFIGLLILIGFEKLDNNLIGMGILAFGALSNSYGSIELKKIKDSTVLEIMTWSYLMAAPQCFLLSLCLEPNGIERLCSASSPAYLGMLCIMCFSYLANYLWNKLLQTYPIHQVLPYSVLVPVFGVSASIIFLGERLSMVSSIGALAIIAGLAILVNKKKMLKNRVSSPPA